MQAILSINMLLQQIDQMELHHIPSQNGIVMIMIMFRKPIIITFIMQLQHLQQDHLQINILTQ